MCGLAGFLDLSRGATSEFLTETGRAMTDALRHRGPDMGDVWTDAEAGIALGFRRLAIIDLSPAGHQPMHSADGRFVMTYNGEIYNYRDLATDLKDRGHAFRGGSDSEVMLELFARDGVEATLPRLVGMFAIALWDRRERRLWLIRDRLGIKPLYFGRQGNTVFWASETKAIRAHPHFEARVDMTAVDGFLKSNFVAAPTCVYRNLEALAPGTLATLDADGTEQTRAYWSMADVAGRPEISLSPEEALERTEVLLSDAVRSRMIADVPLGALLSGGVDSSTVVALMQGASDRPVRTFTIGFGVDGYDEAEHAAAVARHLGTDHTTLDLMPDDARNLIPNLPDWYDEPFADSSALPTYLVCRLARQDVTVALSGDGGDEVFFGYNRHKALNRLSAKLDAIPPLPPANSPPARSPRPAPRSGTRSARAIPSGAAPAHGRNEGGKARPRPRGVRTPIPAISTCSPIGPRTSPAWGWNAVCPTARRIEIRRPAPLGRIPWGYLPNDILTKVDRASMAVSLEARVPLLDHRLVEFAWTPSHGI
jgi:asparagine synthase (glutamine-hydrolysing)